MQSDFSAAGRAARETIPVPALPYDAIRQRSVRGDVRARVQLVAVCFAVALVGISTATGLAERALTGVRIWLSGGNAAVAIGSFEIIRDPLPDDVKRVMDSASFTPVLPTRLPPRAYLAMLMYSPPNRPNTISVQYRSPSGYHSGLTVVATSAVEHGSAEGPATVSRGVSSWQVGDETVVASHWQAKGGQIDALKADLSSAQPRAIPESMLRTIKVLGAPPPVADAVQRYAEPGSVLIGSQFAGQVPQLAKASRPLLDSRIVTLTNIPFKHGPDYAKATYHWSTRTAVRSDGVKAIANVLRTAKPQCTCAVLYSDGAADAYNIALVAASPPYAPTRYAVSKKTLVVHRSDR